MSRAENSPRMGLFTLAPRVFLGVLAVLSSMTLQGCDLPLIEGYLPIMSPHIPTHEIGAWRSMPDYYAESSYTSPDTGQPSFNSCMDPAMNALTVCNGRGVCTPFNRMDVVNPMFFCKCNLGFGGMECQYKQKSQTTAWLISLFFGWIGADEYYLEFNFFVGLKVALFTVAMFMACIGMGRGGLLIILIYWFFDIVRIGSSPVPGGRPQASLAPDLPRWVFVIFTCTFFAFIGFAMGVCSVYFKIKYKRRKDDHLRYYGDLGQFNTKVI